MEIFFLEKRGKSTVVAGRIQEIKGKKTKKQSRDKITIRLLNQQNGNNLLKNKHKLKDVSQFQIYIKLDLTKNESEIQKLMWHQAIEEKIKRNQVKIEYMKVNVKKRKCDENENGFKESSINTDQKN